MLERSLDLRTRRTGKASPPFLSFMKPASVPVPLAQLLQALGHVRCPLTGITVDILPPVLEERKLAEWAVYDEAVLKKWEKFMDTISQYNNEDGRGFIAEHEVFPDMDDYEGKSIGLTATKVELGKVTVRSASKIATKSDLLIRVCNDELFLKPVCSYEDMFVECAEKYDANVVRDQYVSFYYARTKNYKYCCISRYFVFKS